VKITNEREKRKSEMPRKYLRQAPPAVYHNATNSIVFLTINKVDECLKKKRKKNEKRSFSFSFARARARTHGDVVDVPLVSSRLVGDVGTLTATREFIRDSVRSNQYRLPRTFPLSCAR